MFDDKSEVVDGEVVDHSHDKIFFFTFGGVLAFLFGLTVVIYLIAGQITDSGAQMSPVVLERIKENTAPIGAVYTDASAIPVAAPMVRAEPRSGDQVVTTVCGACHSSGVLGALKFSDTAAWKARLDDVGLDALINTAIAGKGSMPPRGGDASLSDAEVRAAVRSMLGKSGL